MSETFKKGQKVYRIPSYRYTNGLEEWTFIRAETPKQGCGFILYDPKDRYRTMHDITEFTADKDKVELDVYKRCLESLNDNIEDNKTSIREAEQDIMHFEKELKNAESQILILHKKFKHLIEKFPEEFI